MSEQVRRYKNLVALGIDAVKATDYDALHAEAEALRAENGRLKQTVEEGLPRLMQQGYEMRTELEAARGLLRESRPAVAYESHRGDEAGRQYQITLAGIDAFLTTTPAPEVQDETLDDRLKQAGMLSVAELLKGAPLDAFIKHAGVHDLATLLQWAEMRRGECLSMMARYDLGEKDKGDDLYEWTVAHCAAFTELHVNLRAALAEQGERQEAVAYIAHGNPGEVWLGWSYQECPPGFVRKLDLYTTPQPAPARPGLVEAIATAHPRIDPNIPVPLDEEKHHCEHTLYLERERLHKLLDAHRQAQQGGNS